MSFLVFFTVAEKCLSISLMESIHHQSSSVIITKVNVYGHKSDGHI